jgi:NADH-quinone oxidoreductase subunit L
VLRHLIKLLIALQILAKAAVLALVLAGSASGQLALGQSLATTVIVADTVTAVIGLALAVQVRRRLGTLDVAALAKLRGCAMATWLTALTMGLPWIGALLVWAVGDRRPQLQHGLAAGFAAAAGLAGLALLPFASSSVALRLPLGGVFGAATFVPDGLGVFLTVVATVIGSLAVLYSADYMRGEAQLGRYYALVLLFIGAMAGLVLASSLLLLLLFWELVAFCSYALISFHNDDPRAVAAGVKALIITQLGGVGLLVGVLAARAYLGDDQISTLLAQAGTLPPAVLRLIAFGFLAAAAAKSAQVPFHTWLPGAMEAPTPISALIHAATMVNAGVYLLARFAPAFVQVPGWATIVVAVGVLSALLGALMALVANDLKRVLAYSTISQLGSMFYAVGAGAIFASQFHLLSHAVFKALLFLGAGAVIQAAGTRDMRRMGGLGRQLPLVGNLFVVGALALVGVPYLNGFWSKELLLEAGLGRGPWWASVGMLIGAGLTALYTFRMVWMVFYGPTQDEGRQTKGRRPSSCVFRLSSPGGLALILLASGTLTTWLLAGPFAQLLGASLPLHDQSYGTTFEICTTILAAPTTPVALTITALGLGAWWWRDRLGWLAGRLGWLAQAAAADFGFEWPNRQIVLLVQRCSQVLRATQTGQLNWNMVGLVGGLVIVLAVLAWGR